jgi:hypothetical protein
LTKPHNPNTERIGVSVLQLFFAEHDWFFREQPILDQGIDAHIEIVENLQATGKLIGLQIKTGPSYFDVDVGDAFVYRPEQRHVSYWTNHSLPVVVVLYDPTTKKGYWQCVTEEKSPKYRKRLENSGAKSQYY